MKRIHLVALVCFFAVVVSHNASAARLRSPWDLEDVRQTDTAYVCPEPAHLSPDLTTDGFYSDRKSSVIDPARLKAYNESSGPYKKLGDEVVDAADAYRTTGSRAAAQCVLKLLSTAAADGVFTGKMSSRQAYYVQGWVIGAAAIAYLKIRNSGVVQPQSHAALAAWMKTVARQSMDFYDASRASAEPGNNHLYWAGVEIAAIAIAADDRSLFDWAVAAYRNGVQQIAADGTLPLEMRRGQRALHYHLYAIAPLVYLADFGKVNGLDLFAETDFALKRLVNRSIAGLNGSGYFDQQTGIPQDTPKGPPTAEEISWGKAYIHYFPDAQISDLLARSPSLSYMYLGGLPQY